MAEFKELKMKCIANKYNPGTVNGEDTRIQELDKKIEEQ
jgi:hypothetical protein